MANILRNICIRSYRTYAIIGIIILLIQLYLAYKYIPSDVQGDIDGNKKSPYKKSSNFIEYGENGGVSARKSKDGFVIDDEDNPGETGSVKRKHNSNNKEMTKYLQNKSNSSLRLEELDFVPQCEIKTKEAISAIHRAKTQRCKQHIANVTCAIQSGQFYEEYLPNSCPNNDATYKKPLGCFKDEKNFRLLSGYYANYKEKNSPEYCINMCLQGGFSYAGVEYSTECFCGETAPPSASKLADSSCNMKCPGNQRQLCGGYFTMNVYQTGIAKFVPQTAAVVTDSSITPVRIVFLLTLNGRASRQVRRLVNILYDEKHYFYIHVDARQDFLYRELLSLEKIYPNVKLARKRYSTIWGGASLLEMLLDSMANLLSYDWKWDFVINLSESDFPIKSLEKLEEFLTANKGKNFVKSHGREVQRFIQKQGLDKTFVECDVHMWRVGDRRLPWGVQIDGGSDWVALDRKFVSYVASSKKDTLISGLLTVFKHTLLPAESFFHTVLRNSKFCNTYIDNNLHVTNWKRKLGCKCQYKHVVDWCGCSPNDFRTEDWPRLQATEQRQLFFARKFEPIVNQAIILRVEQWISEPLMEQIPNIDAYWQSVYHYADLSPPPDDALITISASVSRHNAKMLSEVGCNISPGKILEVTSYHYADVFKGDLILHEVEMEDIGSVKLETWFKHQHQLQVNRATKVSSRLKTFAVSSEYDQKEQMFRNLARTLGPFSEPSLMYHFIPDIDEPLSSNNVSLLWIDPAGNLAEMNELHIEDGSVISFLKPNLKSPLLPGMWTLKMIESNKLAAVTHFLITPLQFMSSNEISQQELTMVHGGPTGLYEDFSSQWNNIKAFIPSHADKKVLSLRTEANAKRLKLDLKEWIDGLVSKFFSVLGTCILTKDKNKIKCDGITLESCHSTSWSSFAPDPKTFNSKMYRNFN